MNPGHRVQYAAMRLVSILVNAITLRAALGMGSLLGRTCWAILAVRREISRINIRQAFPSLAESEVDRIGRDSYRNAGRFMVEFARQPGMGRAYAGKYIEIEPTPALREFLDTPTGLLAISFHFGNWEYGGIVTGFLKPGTAFLVGEQRNELVDGYINRLRGSHGNRLLTRDAAMRGIVAMAKNGGAASWLSDQDAVKNGIVVPFFGHPASTPRGAAAFSVKLGIPIACSFMVRTRGPRQRFVLRAVLHPLKDLPRDEAERDITERYTKVLEDAVRENPDHYWWAHRRWKTTGLYVKGRVPETRDDREGEG